MKCSCDREIPLTGIVRKCTVCGKRICAECMGAKTERGQNFLCHKCAGTYAGRSVRIDNNIRGNPNNGSCQWGIFAKSGNVMFFEVEGKTMMGCGPIADVIKMVDILVDDRILGTFVKFYIGRIYMPEALYPPLKVNHGTRDFRILESEPEPDVVILPRPENLNAKDNPEK